jgi:hypothetical protein
LGYLKCEKCGGYYELQDGESPADFESCECGGILKYTENVDNINSQLKETPITLTCPLCGTENPEIAEFCASCGNDVSKENEKTILRDEKVSNLQKKFNKSPNRVRYKNKVSIALILVVLILLFIGVYFANIISNNSHSNYNLNVTENVASSNSNTPTTSKSNSGDDYDRGYDEGYFSGVNEAYSDWPYADEVSKSLEVSETWRQGYKAGYKQGYNDIKNGNSLKKPRIQGTAILDPRTNEKIYS